MKVIKSKYDLWQPFINDQDDFKRNLFSAYYYASKEDKIKFQKMWPKLFIPYPERGDEIEVWNKKKKSFKIVLDNPWLTAASYDADIMELAIGVNVEVEPKKLPTRKEPVADYRAAYWSFEKQRWEI